MSVPTLLPVYDDERFVLALVLFEIEKLDFAIGMFAKSLALRSV